MKLFGRLCTLSLVGTLGTAPVWACGPFLFANDELDSLSLIDPGIVGDASLEPFYLYASPGFGQPSDFKQEVIQADRIPMASDENLSNLVYDYDTGADPEWTRANVEEWTAYLRSTRGRRLTEPEVEAALDGKGLPSDSRTDDKAYFALLSSAPASDSTLADVAARRAREVRLSAFLRERYAYLALRAAATGNREKPSATDVWAEFKPLFDRGGLVAGRALSWIAGSPSDQNPGLSANERIDDFLGVFERFPALRVSSYVSLGTFSDGDWSGYLAENLAPERRALALFVRFILEDRDFSPETLQAAVNARPGGAKALFVLYRMVETIEREAGTSRLLALTFDPASWTPGPDSSASDKSVVATVSKSGLYTALVDVAEQAGLRPDIRYPRAWLTLAAYLAFYDGNEARMRKLYEKSLSFPSANEAQTRQSHVLGTMIEMMDQRNSAWDALLQRRVIDDLVWARTLDKPGRNRGLYHSLVILAAQKDLALNRRDAAARTFASLQTSQDSPYLLRSDDDFWANSWGSNDSVNLLFDVLLRPEDLSAWRDFLRKPARLRDPLDAYLDRGGWVTESDLDYLEAYKDLRRGDAKSALPLLDRLAGQGYFSGQKTWRNDASPFPVREFSYSTEVDPVDPGSGKGLRKATLAGLAREMAALADADPTTQGNFWFSLQLSGFPLLFSAPPQVISFVGNWQFYDYDGSDENNPSGLSAAVFPLFEPGRAAGFRKELVRFQSTEFSATNRALSAYREGAEKGKTLESQALAWAMVAFLSQDKEALRRLASPRYRVTETYQDLKSNCETLRTFL